MNNCFWYGLLASPVIFNCYAIAASPALAESALPGKIEEVKPVIIENQIINKIPLPSKNIGSEKKLNLEPPITLSRNISLESNLKELDINQKIAQVELISQMSDIQPSDSLLETNNADLDLSDDGMTQVTNISQLRDVQPSDWAYEAVRSLVERYGCIAGYPDSTFRGNRALSRYEFAAGLNACLTQIEKLVAANVNNPNRINRQDLETIKRLTDEFAAEIGTLRARTDKLEERTAFLEQHQFSPTTKLSGLVWFNLTGATSGGDVRVETSDINVTPLPFRPAGRDINNNPQTAIALKPNITFSNLIWLTLETSFTGKDSLVTQLAAGNGDSPANAFASANLYNTFGTPFLDQTGGIDPGSTQVVLRELFYRFPVSDRLQVVVGPRINWYRYFDNNAFTFFINGATSFNSNGSTLLNTIDRGAGAAILWNPSNQLSLRFAYLGESQEFLPNGIFNTAANPAKGLFGPTNTATAELTYSPNNRFNIRFIYNRSNINPVFGKINGPTTEPIYGVADDGFGGDVRNSTADTFGVNFDWLVSSRFGVFGRYTYGSTQINPINPLRPGGKINAQAIQLGLAFPDLGKQGAQGILSFGIPFDVRSGRNFLVAGGGNGGTQYEFEASYYYPITNNIALVPAFYAIINPNNFSNNPAVYVGNLRTQFSF